MNHRPSTKIAALRTTVWPGLLAALAALAALACIGLLSAFHQVVQGGVDQAALRQQTSALPADADWRCRVAPAPARHAVLPGAGSAADGQGSCQEPQ